MKRPKFTLMGILMCLVGTFVFFRPLVRFYETPKLGNTSSQVREKMGTPTLVYRTPKWPNTSTQSHWHVLSEKTNLLPEELPSIKEARWYYQVGFLHTEFLLIDFEAGRVSEIYWGGT